MVKEIDNRKHSKLLELAASIKSLEINGQQILQTPDGDFVEYVLMEEEFFVDNWLSQFAIGRVGGKNYFNQQGWNVITDGYTKGVIVINEDKDAVLIIRKFIDMNLNANQRHALESYTRGASETLHIQDKARVDEAVDSLSIVIGKITEIKNPDYDVLTAMIPLEYYLSKGINPFVMKQVIYIRDTYKYKDIPMVEQEDVLKKVEQILHNNIIGMKIPIEDIKLVTEITNGEFIFNGSENVVETNKPVQPEKPYDPFSE